VSYPRKRTTNEILGLFTKVATTNHFELEISAIPPELKTYIQKQDPFVSNYFIQRELGLLCKGVDIPGAAFATAQVSGNYMGIQQKYAHTRIFTESSFSFIVDNEYKVLKFFEIWQKYISGAGEVSDDKKAFYTRMQYPDSYKIPVMRLKKFDRDHFRSVTYSFINAFPINITPTAISYEGNRVLEINVAFNYDRYVLGEVKSLKETDKSKEQLTGSEYTNKPAAPAEEQTTPPDNNRRLVPVRGNSGVVFYDRNEGTRTEAEVNRRFYDSQGRSVIN